MSDAPITAIAGADGCPSGWLVVRALLPDPDAPPTELTCALVTDLAELFTGPDPVQLLAIDMPIGLPAEARKGGRDADRGARALLGRRGASVFSPPCRAALDAPDYPAALAANRASSPDQVGLSKQAWNIAPRIRHLDALLQSKPDLRPHIFEVHPELAFLAMSTVTRKAIPPASKHTAEGLAQRHRLLNLQGIDLQPALRAVTLERLGTEDDALDACACLWSAARIAADRAQRLPEGEPPPTDPTGLPMTIWW